MCLIKTFFVVFLIHSALATEAGFDPCMKDDIKCLTSAAQGFLEKTCLGIPKFNIKAIDPMHIENIEVTLDSGKIVNLKNVTVTGLKKLQIHDFKIDTNKKDVLLAMENQPAIVANIEVKSEDKTVFGTLTVNDKVIPTARYNYDLVKNDKGVEYFTVGPETLTCVLVGVPNIKVNQEINNVLLNDSKTDETKKKLLCSVVQEAFSTVIHNLRESSKLYPKSAYFIDL